MDSGRCTSPLPPAEAEGQTEDDRSHGIKVTRRPFYASEKKAVCEMFRAEEGITHQQLADRFNVSRSMITRILKNSDKWLRSKHDDGAKFARKRNLKFWPIERRMSPWLIQCREDNISLTDKMIMDRAIEIAYDEGMRGGGHIYQFSCSPKWLRNFKARFGIINGVATRVGYTAVDLAREKAYGYYPLDMGFWLQLPDEHGNVPEQPPRRKAIYDDWDWEEVGNFIEYKEPPTATDSTSSLSSNDTPYDASTSPFPLSGPGLDCSDAVADAPSTSNVAFSQLCPPRTLSPPPFPSPSSRSPHTGDSPPMNFSSVDMSTPLSSGTYSGSQPGMFGISTTLPPTFDSPDNSAYISPPRCTPESSSPPLSFPATPPSLTSTFEPHVASPTLSLEAGIDGDFLLQGTANPHGQWSSSAYCGDAPIANTIANTLYAPLDQQMPQSDWFPQERFFPQALEHPNTSVEYLGSYNLGTGM